MKTVVVLKGGMSDERTISLQTGEGVAHALIQAGYRVFSYDVTPDIPALVRFLNETKPDAVFNALHGRYGEDGCIQGMLEMMRLPYTHSGVLASALAMDKERAKQMVSTLGIAVPKTKRVTRQDICDGFEFSFPYVVKPNDSGSSVGVFLVFNEADRARMLDVLSDNVLYLMEDYIPGRELSVAVTDAGALGIVEIIPKDGFYDFSHKYTAGTALHVVPAPIPEQDSQTLMTAAYQIHRLFGCKDVSRSDFRYDDITDPEHPRFVFLELNTNPGMTELSLVPDVAKFRGISYTDLVCQLIENARCEK